LFRPGLASSSDRKPQQSLTFVAGYFAARLSLSELLKLKSLQICSQGSFLISQFVVGDGFSRVHKAAVCKVMLVPHGVPDFVNANSKVCSADILQLLVNCAAPS